jgi:hypothetical protein
VEKRSESSEETSTPVGPAPTMTKWRRECFWEGVRPGMEAFSKQSWSLEAMSMASLAVRRKRAFSDTPGVPKVWLVLWKGCKYVDVYYITNWRRLRRIFKKEEV